MSSEQLSPAPGSKKSPKRLGRGRGCGLGKTSGRGQKGAGARAGNKHRPWFEGGQMPIQRRLPKRGFKPLSRNTFQIVNLTVLSGMEANSTITPIELAAKGCIIDSSEAVKILGQGELKKPLHVKAHKFSKSAEEKIRQAGGTVTVLPVKPQTAETTS